MTTRSRSLTDKVQVVEETLTTTSQVSLAGLSNQIDYMEVLETTPYQRGDFRIVMYNLNRDHLEIQATRDDLATFVDAVTRFLNQ